MPGLALYPDLMRGELVVRWNSHSRLPTHLSSLFPHCCSLRLLRQLHAQLLLHGFHLSAVVASSLAYSYFRLHSPHQARRVFDQIPRKTPRSWNTMLSGYFRSHDLADLLRLYKASRTQNHRPDSFSLAFGVRACVGLSLFELGRSIHSEAIRSNFELDEFVCGPLIDLYSELGALEDAEKVFGRVPLVNSSLWGLMMKAYLRASIDIKTFDLFHRMNELGLEIDQLSAICLVRACGNVQAGIEGGAIHAFCLKKNLLTNIYLQTSLLDMCGKSGLIYLARKMFDEIPHKDVVPWSSMIASLARCGRACDSLDIFRGMLEESIVPNGVSLASVLLACSHLGALQQGRSIHAYMVRSDVEFDVVSSTALLDMYAKCGSEELAYKVFSEMPEKNVFSWSAMIGGFGMHGMYSRALDLFDRMRSENVSPNSVTFEAVLSACSQLGRVQEGRHYFESMVKDYKLKPKDQHYPCIVDLVERSGLIEEAKSLIREMPTEPSPSVMALLGAYQLHRPLDSSMEIANKPFVLLSDFCTAAGVRDKVKHTRQLMNQRRLQETIGFSTIEVDKRVHIFYATCRRDWQNEVLLELWQWQHQQELFANDITQ